MGSESGPVGSRVVNNDEWMDTWKNVDRCLPISFLIFRNTWGCLSKSDWLGGGVIQAVHSESATWLVGLVLIALSLMDLNNPKMPGKILLNYFISLTIPINYLIKSNTIISHLKLYPKNFTMVKVI